jgi:hypothetical protein
MWPPTLRRPPRVVGWIWSEEEGTYHAGGGALEDRKEGAMVEGGGRC